MMLLEGKLGYLEFVADAQCLHGLAAQCNYYAWCSTIGANLQLEMHCVEHSGVSLDNWKPCLDQYMPYSFCILYIALNCSLVGA